MLITNNLTGEIIKVEELAIEPMELIEMPMTQEERIEQLEQLVADLASLQLGV